MIELRTPTLELLPRYVDALQRGWMPDHIIGIAATQEQLAAIEQDAAGFIARQTNLEARGESLAALLAAARAKAASPLSSAVGDCRAVVRCSAILPQQES